MKKKIFSAICMLSTTAAISAVNSVAQQTDDRKPQRAITLKAQRGTTARGGEADPNIKKDEMPNDINTSRGGDTQTVGKKWSTRGVQEIELTSQKGTVARGGVDPNIKEDEMLNDYSKKSVHSHHKKRKN